MAQCNVNLVCLIHPASSYICLEEPPAATMFLSDFIAPNGPLPQGGGFVNVIIDGNLVVDVDYTFDSGAHIVLTPGSSIEVNDRNPNNNTGPHLAIIDGSVLTSCGGYWEYVSVAGNYTILEIEDAVIADGGYRGISVINDASFSSINSDYGNFLYYGIALGSEGGDLGQNIGFTFVKNTFWGIAHPLRILNTQMISIGRDNNFFSPGPLVGWGIEIQNSSVSIGSGNKVEGYQYGIIDHNPSGGNYFLNLYAVTFKGNLSGVFANSAVDQILSGNTAGISLFVRNSIFEESRDGIVAKIQNGGTAKIQQNTIDYDNGNSIVLQGDFPRWVEVIDNILESIEVSSGILINMPAWNAGNNMKIVRNTANVTQVGVSATLASGGMIEDNDITTSNSTGIQVVNTSGLRIAYNNVTASGGDGQLSGCIYLQNSPNCKLVCNNTYDGGAGLSFSDIATGRR